jgi:hypothetical protein
MSDDNNDPKCGVCGERRSVHVPSESGPLTHPREARGEGMYRLVSPGWTMSGAMDSSARGWRDDIEIPPSYEFVPKTVG